MLVHDCNSLIEYLKSLHEFENESILGQINIPVLITRASKDAICDQAEIVYNKLVSCNKNMFMVFGNQDGTTEHRQTGARMLFSESVFAWLDGTLPDH
jgi:hypothetical protein